MNWIDHRTETAFKIIQTARPEEWKTVDFSVLPSVCERWYGKMYVFSDGKHRLILKQEIHVGDGAIFWDLIDIDEHIITVGRIQTPAFKQEEDLFHYLSKICDPKHQDQLEHYNLALQGICSVIEPSFSMIYSRENQMWIRSIENTRFGLLQEELDQYTNILLTTAHPDSFKMISNSNELILQRTIYTSHEKLFALEKAYQFFPKTMEKIRTKRPINT